LTGSVLRTYDGAQIGIPTSCPPSRSGATDHEQKFNAPPVPAIRGEATYTGEKIGWEQAAQSQELLGPKEYAWGPIAMPAVAQPGITKFA